MNGLRQNARWRSAVRSALTMLIIGAVAPAIALARPLPQVVLDTSLGRIVLALEVERAPVTSCNFIRYVRDGRYDGGQFYRTVHRGGPDDNPVPIDVIQADGPPGPSSVERPAIPLERTSKTGLSHVAGVVSMARGDPDSATSSFFIVVENSPSLDFAGGRNADGQGFAAFGHVLSGMDAVRAIHDGAADGQTLREPVVIRRAEAVGGEGACLR
jgi:peptidyl-prolyl cis-trans isomerase A (cyclophilin A)